MSINKPNYHFFRGTVTTPGAVLTNAVMLSATETSITRVPASNIITGIPNNPWVRGMLLTPFGLPEVAGRSNYVNYNGKVYVCLSNNTESRIGTINPSTDPPTGTGIFTTLDGHRYLHLYDITSNVNKFVGSYIPCPSWGALKETIDAAEVSTSILCAAGSTGMGKIYQRNTTVGQSNTANLLTTISDITCETCSTLATEVAKTDSLIVKFFTATQTIPASITIDPYSTRLDNLISNKTLNDNLNFQVKAYSGARTAGFSAGCVYHTFINLPGIDGVSAAYRIIPSNTTLGFSGDGVGCVGAFLTTTNQNGTLTIHGMNSISGGSGYSVTPTIVIGGSMGNDQRNTLIDNITVVSSVPSNLFDNIPSIFDVSSRASVGYQKVADLVRVEVNPNDIGTNNIYTLIPPEANTKSTNLQDVAPISIKAFELASTSTVHPTHRSITFINPKQY